MAIELTTPDKLAAKNGIKCLVYGESGMGKTLLAATCPSPIVLSAEPGTLSLRRANIEAIFGKDKPGITYDVPVVAMYDLASAEEVLRWAQSNAINQFDTIVIDSASELGRFFFNDASEKFKGKAGKADGRQVYGDVQIKLLDLFYKLKHLPGKNIVAICHARRFPATEHEPEMIGPNLPTQRLGRESPHEFDEVFQLRLARTKDGELKRYLKTAPDEQGYAKDRSGALNAKEPANLSVVFDKILKPTGE